MPTVTDYVRQYIAIDRELSRLLELSSQGDDPISTGPVGELLRHFVERLDGADERTIEARLLRLQLLAEHLLAIERHDRALLDGFKRELRNRPEEGDFYGIRCEIATAAMLIERGINFTKRESPDFELPVDGDTLFIECGSAHLSKPANRDIAYKVGSVVNQKKAKPYCTPKLALFAEVTNILAQSHLRRAFDVLIRPFVEREMAGSGLGSVLLFMFVYDHDVRDYAHHYVRIDNGCIDEGLRTFLDRHFPQVRRDVRRFIIPWQV